VNDRAPEYQLTIKSLRSDVPPHVRLRMILKALLRAYQFRCVDVRELQEEGKAADSVGGPPGSQPPEDEFW
jgi:hypothetical protein